MEANHTMSKDKIGNNLFWVFLITGAVFLFAFILCALTADHETALFTGILSVITAIGVLVCPVSFVFDEKKLTAVFLTRKQVILYSQVLSVMSCGLFESYDNLPKYEIIYVHKYKGRSVTKVIDIPKNKKTKRIFEKYLGHKSH